MRREGPGAAFAFLTPLGRAAVPVPPALAWFPVVGASIGGLLGLAWWGTRHWWGPGPAAAIVVVLDLVLTGMLHVDGLVDSADGLLPHLPRERRLAVMAEPTIGAFGLAVGAVTLLVRWVALDALAPSIVLLVGLWVASRTAIAVVAVGIPYARDHGLARAFLGGGSKRSAEVAAIVGSPAALVCVVLWRAAPGAIALTCGVVAAAGVVALARRRLGGYTGDVLGAAAVVLETVALLVASAHWPH